MLTTMLGALALASSAHTHAMLVVFNATASAPLGWYGVRHGAGIAVGDYVLANLPDTAATLADARGYLPRGIPILKRVAATASSVVCVRGNELSIDGANAAAVLEVDSSDRPLPHMRGCRVASRRALPAQPRPSHIVRQSIFRTRDAERGTRCRGSALDLELSNASEACTRRSTR